MKHAVVKSLLHRGGDFAHVSVALAEIHVVANADDLREERNHVRGLAHGLAVGDLRFLLVEIGEAKAEGVDRRRETETRARRVIAKDRDREARIEDAQRFLRAVQLRERLGDEREGADFGVRFFPREQEIFSEGVSLQLRKLREIFLEDIHILKLSA